MSFCLLAPPHPLPFPTTPSGILFAKVLAETITSRLLVLVSGSGQVSGYCLESGDLMVESMLEDEGLAIKGVVEIKQINGILYFITFHQMYWACLKDITESINQKNRSLNLNPLICRRNQSTESIAFEKLMNRQIHVSKHHGNSYLKLAGRTKSALNFYFLLLDMPSRQAKVLFMHEEALTYETTFSLNSLQPELMIYLAYCSKSKPLKIDILEFLPCERGADHIKTSVDILHFSEQLTVLEVFKVSQHIICVFANNSFEEKAVSLMITYNFKEKFTLNYVQFKDAVIERVLTFIDSRSHSLAPYQKIKFDAFAYNGQKSHYFQLKVKSYHQEEDTSFEGKVLTSDKDYVVSQCGSGLFIIPKVHKKAIYFKFLRQFKVEISLSRCVLELLE